MSVDRLQDELRNGIGQIRRRWTGFVRRRAFTRATIGAALAIIVTVIAERVLHPAGVPLLLLMAVGAVLGAAAIVWAILRMPARPSDHQVARFIEERTPLNDSLVSAIDVSERPAGAQPAFLALLLEDALGKLRAIDPASLVTRDEIRRHTIAASAGALALIAALILSWPSFDRAAATARLKFFPASVTIQVQPGNTRIPIGTPVRIRATVAGGSASFAQLTPTLTVFANGQQRAVPMTAAADGFNYVIESVDRSFSYDVTLGAARSARYAVTALRPPRVERIDLHYVYPSFARLAPRDEQDGGDIYAPAGTRVSLRIQTDKPIANGELTLGQSPAVPLTLQEDCTVEAEVVLAKDDSYRIHLADEDGLTSRGEAEYFIRVMDDRPPDVRILRPSADQEITPLEEVAIEARADDDYGIDRFELVYGVAGRSEHTVPFERVTGTNVQKIGTRLLPAEELGVKPGDVITYYARARDVSRGKRATEATSDIYFLEVKPFNEEFTAAESQAGAGASDPEIEGLIQAQKEIIASTWNVERRAQGARSSEDVKAIAAAQSELKARAEKQLMTRTMRTRPQEPAPAPQQRVPVPNASRGSGDDAAASAVGAMGKAIDQLTADRTKEALPHEMSALNGLLQLQAEVRRRQVSQGAGSGNAWGNRQGQDLSALFDKELQRQQRNNYETRAAAELKPDSADKQTSALDRIRELAKRQEDLNRRQRELAASNLSPEEMKRQLDKLTREQTELREQTEELLRRNGQQNGASQGQQSRQSGEGSGQTQSGGELRDAADQMRSAASDLRRENPGEAARNGERAAGQLRRLERLMQGDGQSRQGRASGDMKLEAQQIAQEQHRIATEAGRLGRNNSGAATADARKRLAEEKDTLASRVDDLAKGAQQLSREASPPDAKALENSARALQRDKIADRMRGGARQLREGQGTISGAAEEDLARSLDQVARGLGATESPMSNPLEETRAIRDGLQRAEQQLHEAEARARGSNTGGASAGDSPRGANGRQGTGSSEAAREVERLRNEYQRELQRADDAMRRLKGGGATGSLAGSTPEQQEFSRSAPGTEAFKQDRSGWESLRKNLDTELERYEASVSDRMARAKTDERFSAGGSDRVPDAYSELIARYFESLAKKKK